MAFLIPIGVVFYAAVGGLKSTFTTSYVHTGGFLLHAQLGMHTRAWPLTTRLLLLLQ